VSPVKYKLGFYIPEDGIPHSHRRENLKLCKEAIKEGIREEGGGRGCKAERTFKQVVGMGYCGGVKWPDC
jgi:hypothetical protein